jgi:protein-S-isoprenylcysteine O-methyltransferase Ste14
MLLTLVSIAGYLLMVAAILLLLLVHGLFANNVAAIVVQALAVLLMIWARAAFGRRSFHAAGSPTEGGVVTTGPYRYIRHPIYAAVLYFIWAGVLCHLSAETLAPGAVAVIGVALRVFVEERLVVERYPEYREYAARTKRLIPYLL